MGYEVRWADALEVRDDLLAVGQRNLALSIGARPWFDWLYLDNPAGHGGLAVLESTLPGEGARVVGVAGCAARGFAWRGRVLRGATLVSPVIDREHRTPATVDMLSRALRDLSLARFELIHTTAEEPAAASLIEHGHRKLGDTRRFLLTLRHASMLKTRLGEHAGAAAGAGLDLARGVLLASGAARAALEYHLQWSEEVDARFDDLWREASGDHSLLGVRDAAFLRWRFARRPEGRVEFGMLVNRRTEALAGYVAVSRVENAVQIRDIFGHRATFEPLLQLVTASLARQEMESLSVQLYGAPPLVTALHALGFRERRDHRLVVGQAGGALLTASPEIVDVDRWFLTDADDGS
jgi:hypothetical protein